MSVLLLLSGIVGPVAAQTTADRPMTRDVEDDGFDDWGLLGLLGLAGLLGRNRRDKNVVEARRV
jgi:MYXO-CTERM domain-containing protein